MLKQTNQWHFARPKLAHAYIQSFELGLSSARGLFARRRMGKTEFLKQDFIPAAEAVGYVAVYVNLWDMRSDPAQALIAAFFQAVEPKGYAKIWEKLKQPVKKVKASGKVHGIGEGAIEADLFDDKTAMAGTMLMEAMRVFDKRKLKVVLIIDEAQVLAHESNADFAHALRAALDIRKERIKVLFAGSSEGTLRRMFGRASEPFYNWAALEPFELLGRDFVESMVEKVAMIAKTPLEVTHALQAFDELQRTPEFFRNYLDRYLTNPFDGAQGALDHTKGRVFNTDNFQRQWNDLLPTDRVVLSLVAAGITDIYGKEAKKQMGEDLGLGQPMENSAVQNSLRRMGEKTLVTKIQRGQYQLEDEAFAEWIRDNELGD